MENNVNKLLYIVYCGVELWVVLKSSWGEQYNGAVMVRYICHGQIEESGVIIVLMLE